MKRIIVTLICIRILFSATQLTAKTLELVTLQYPPYEYEEKGQIKGVAVEVVKEVFKRMQQPIYIKLLPWARSIKMIEEGTADAIFTAYKNPERETFADYSKEVLMAQVISLFVLKNSPIKFDGDLSKLKKYSFGTVRQVSYGTIFDDAVKNGIIKAPDFANTGEQNIGKLIAKRFDILVSNKYGALNILKEKGAMDKVIELSPVIQDIPSYIAFSKKRNLASIRDKFDVILAQIKKDGTYDRIIRNYFK